MGGAINIHLFDCCCGIVRYAARMGGLTISFHLPLQRESAQDWMGFFAAAAPIEIGFSPIHKSTVRPIVPDVGGKLISGVVALPTVTRLSDEEKLEVLRRLDQFRRWHSLDERRYCLVCGTIISGRQIQVDGGTRGNGPLRLNCPTELCNSIPMDWVLPTDEVLAKVEKMAAEKRETADSKSAAAMVDNGKSASTAKGHDDLMSRLLRFVLPFKRYS